MERVCSLVEIVFKDYPEEYHKGILDVVLEYMRTLPRVTECPASKKLSIDTLSSADVSRIVSENGLMGLRHLISDAWPADGLCCCNGARGHRCKNMIQSNSKWPICWRHAKKVAQCESIVMATPPPPGMSSTALQRINVAVYAPDPTSSQAALPTPLPTASQSALPTTSQATLPDAASPDAPPIDLKNTDIRLLSHLLIPCE